MSRVNDAQSLGEHVAETQDRWLEHAVPLGPLREGFLLRVASRRARKPNRAVWLAVAAVGLCAGAFALGQRLELMRERPLVATVREKEAKPNVLLQSGREERLPVDFSDGSRITLDPNTSLRMAELRTNGVSVALEAGGLDVSVKHRTETDYRLTLGPYLVRVTGTRFHIAVSKERDAIELVMHEGSVLVSGCALTEPRPVRGGEVLTASCRDSGFKISRTAPDQAPPGAPAEPPSNIEASAATTEPLDPKESPRNAQTRTSAETGWQSLARAGKFGPALTILQQLGFQRECQRGSSAELALMADVARYGKRPEQAILALTTLRQRFPGTGQASLAAFTLARVHFDQRRAYDEAARWFRTYLKEQPGGALAREAQGRLMEALDRAGDRAAAAQLAKSYLATNPDGPHARLARALIAR